MSVPVDRRAFLTAAGQLTLGAMAAATSPPPMPPPKAEDGLKIMAGEGLLATPAGATARLGEPRLRVHGYLNAIQFSPNGNTLVAASGDELRAWDPRTGKVLFRLDYPAGASVDAGRLTSRDTFALLVRPSSGNKLEFRHYAFGTGKHISHTPPVEVEHVQQTSFSTDGTLAAIVRQEGLCLYDTGTGKERWRESLPAEAVGGCQFFPDSSAVAVATKGVVKVHDTTNGKMIAELRVGPVATDGGPVVPGERGRDWVEDLVVSADGKWLAAGVGDDGDEVCVWDVKARLVRHRLKPAAKPLGFTPDGAELATFKEGTVTFWKTGTGHAARTFDVPADDDLALSPDGKVLASTAGDAAILIDAGTGLHLPHSAAPPGTPERMWFTAEGRLIGLLSGWGGWVEWDLATRKSRLIRPDGVSGRIPIALSTNGRVGLYRRKDDYEARQIPAGTVVMSAAGLPGRDTDIPVSALTPDGQTLVLPAEGGLALVRGKDRRVIKRHGDLNGEVAGVSVSPDGRLAASGFRGGNDKHPIELYDLAAGRFVRRIVIDGDVRQMEFTPDGLWLAVSHHVEDRSGQGDRVTVTVFDVSSGRTILQTTSDEHRQNLIALSPDNRVLARWEHVDGDGEKVVNRIAVCEVRAGKVRARFDAGGSVSSLAFSPNGRTLAASVSGAPVFLWDLYAQDKEQSPAAGAQLERGWADLKGDDAVVAFTAIKRLARSPAAVAFLRDKVPPVAPPDAAQVGRWIADLDHREYRRRETAARALGELGERVREPMQKALAGGASPEVRERIERLLAAEERPTPEQLRRFRAVEAVEVAGTPEAEKLLAVWAGGAPGAGLTNEARRALKRLSARVPT